jgi:hypothetical protein
MSREFPEPIRKRPWTRAPLSATKTKSEKLPNRRSPSIPWTRGRDSLRGVGAKRSPRLNHKRLLLLEARSVMARGGLALDLRSWIGVRRRRGNLSGQMRSVGGGRGHRGRRQRAAPGSGAGPRELNSRGTPAPPPRSSRPPSWRPQAPRASCVVVVTTVPNCVCSQCPTTRIAAPDTLRECLAPCSI